MAITTSIFAQNGDTIQVIPFGRAESPASKTAAVLAGRIAGVISTQANKDSTQFWINCGCPSKSSSALVLIDGVEGDLNRLRPEDIQSFSIIKDAKAIEMYGVRGANGVVIVTTKLGNKDLTNTNIVETVTLLEPATKIGNKNVDTSDVEPDSVITETEDFLPDLKIYPNPFSGTLRLAGAEGCSLQVITEDGIVVHTQKLLSPLETILLEHLWTGVYFFCVSNGNQTKMIKGVKN